MITSKPKNGEAIAGTSAPTGQMSQWMRDVTQALNAGGALISSNAQVSATGYYEVDATAGPVTVTVAPSAQAGWPFLTIKKTDASVNAVTVAINADGATSFILAAQWSAKTFVPSPANNGTWGVIASI